MLARYPIGTQFKQVIQAKGKYSVNPPYRVCTVTDIFKTYNSQGDH